MWRLEGRKRFDHRVFKWQHTATTRRTSTFSGSSSSRLRFPIRRLARSTDSRSCRSYPAFLLRDRGLSLGTSSHVLTASGLKTSRSSKRTFRSLAARSVCGCATYEPARTSTTQGLFYSRLLLLVEVGEVAQVAPETCMYC